jgi:hypothetical protein
MSPPVKRATYRRLVGARPKVIVSADTWREPACWREALADVADITGLIGARSDA